MLTTLAMMYLSYNEDAEPTILFYAVAIDLLLAVFLWSVLRRMA